MDHSHRALTWLALLAAFITVLPPLARAGDPPLRNVIDTEIAKVWSREKIQSAGPCDDATFLRRVSLDLCGLIPTHDEAKAFLDDSATDKRAKLIERLLDHARYGVHQSDEWDMVFFGRKPPGYEAPHREGFKRWLRDSFAQNTHFDQLARAMLKAEGNTAEQGAAMYLVQYDRHPDDAAIAVSQTFLGVQLQCAHCHDHPYEPWTQRDFYGMAAFFARLQMVKAGKTKVDDKELEKIYLAELNTGDVKFTGSAKDAKPGQKGEPVKPKFLLASDLEEPDLTAEFKDEKRIPDGSPPPAPKFSRKDKLAEWVTSPQNPYFARAVANRLWAQFMGRGLVHPIDNMSASNKPSHPELLDAIAQELIAHQFDVKWLIRELVSSQTYQLASTGEVADAKPQWFERARTRPLSAEELLESWRVATNFEVVARRKPEEHKGRFYGVTFDYIRNYFGEPNNGVGDFQGGLHEHLYLNNGELGRLMTSEKDGLIDQLLTSTEPWESRVERIYLAVLSRLPNAAERAKFADYCDVQGKDSQQTRLQEAIWVLMTCSEFRFNH
ncbi:MAG: hypothetical protein JWM11_229 [Planctomycetaceae bacterium]|nr:hypothetical protein [Planctomycetaceae bacterium]